MPTVVPNRTGVGSRALARSFPSHELAPHLISATLHFRSRGLAHLQSGAGAGGAGSRVLNARMYKYAHSHTLKARSAPKMGLSLSWAALVLAATL